MLMPWPRSVPPSAIIRYHQSPIRYRWGASGNINPLPDHSDRGGSSARPAVEVDPHLLDAEVAAAVGTREDQAGVRQVAVVAVPRQVGIDAVDALARHAVAPRSGRIGRREHQRARGPWRR